jgi:hypothetical protein
LAIQRRKQLATEEALRVKKAASASKQPLPPVSSVVISGNSHSVISVSPAVLDKSQHSIVITHPSIANEPTPVILDKRPLDGVPAAISSSGKKSKKQSYDVSASTRNTEFGVECLKQSGDDIWCNLCGATFANVKHTISDHLKSDKHKKYEAAKMQTVCLHNLIIIHLNYSVG